MDQTKPATDIRNQPADQKLINEHPELQDPSTRAHTPGPQAAAAPPAPPAQEAASERPAVHQAPTAPVQGVSAPNDSHGQPRPFGQGGSQAEKAGTGEARRQATQPKGRKQG